MMSGISLNEDDSHFFGSRQSKDMCEAGVDRLIDTYAGTDVKELLFCPNAMRTSYASEVWDPIWKGYDPKGNDDQPFFAGIKPSESLRWRAWPHNALLLHKKGIDPYARWIAKSRKAGISPWISMRMNDVHCVDNPDSFLHSDLWRKRPDLRRVTDRFEAWTDRAFDYAKEEVRAHHMALIRELARRYDFDGFEMDWMRFGFHFKPGHEAEGSEILTGFTREVRELMDETAKTRGHTIELGARVPSRPATAQGLGMDAIVWAREGLVQRLTTTPFWATIEFDMPIEEWRDLLKGTNAMLCAGLELNVQPYPGARQQANTIETARGVATSLLSRGADRIYLFNYMDSETCMNGMENYPKLLREIGSLERMEGKERRHIVTYSDTWAPEETRVIALPAVCGPGKTASFRIHIGPKPVIGKAAAIISADNKDMLKEIRVKVNGQDCPNIGVVKIPDPGPESPACVFIVPLPALQSGYNLLEADCGQDTNIVWAEIGIGD